jgi:uncharacterized protein YlxW (UPF0749 family)
VVTTLIRFSGILTVLVVVFMLGVSFGTSEEKHRNIEEQQELQEEIQLLEEKNYDLTDQVWSLTNYIDKEMSE